MERTKIREQIRIKRQNLSSEQQKLAAKHCNLNFIQLIKEQKNAKIAIYLTNDGELDTSLLINTLFSENLQIYLPVLHPFKAGNLVFQRYEKNSPMRHNRYGILEPKLNCSHICPVSELDFIFTPLVAFDENGNRLGMGGGFYDRTLARLHKEGWQKPQVIGIAHDCQKVAQLPNESWDVPLKTILTPEKIYRW